MAMVTVERGPVGNTRSIPLSILWAILTLGIYTFFWVYRTYDEMRRYSGRGLGEVYGLLIYLAIFVSGIAIVITGILISNEVQKLYEGEGLQPPHSALWGLWLLLPIIGAFVWFIPTQRALNELWESKGAPPA
jgi:Domain of unknown function (DUF4234)